MTPVNSYPLKNKPSVRSIMEVFSSANGKIMKTVSSQVTVHCQLWELSIVDMELVANCGNFCCVT